MDITGHDLEEWLHDGYRFALALTHDRSEAEELVHDAALRFIRSGRQPGRFALLRAIKNGYIDQLRRSRVRGDVLSFDEAGAAEPAATAPEDQDLPIELHNGALELALDQMRPVERGVMYLWAVEDMTAQQIADLLDCPRSTVLSQLQRGKAKLRQLLEQSMRD